ncbi:MAG: tryptophan synthase subunit alpha [Arcanobacterium sp.]|nr:tryptophan synthase subunit alpha [Arcanobacterium sp.]MDY6143970.1 tryptophan synthase subunit alpha [Arcanobacterium sp.]
MNVKTADVIDRLASQGHRAFIGYLPVGFPTVETSIAAAKEMVSNGVDIVELGFPYSDPTMDGVVIQTAAQRALDAGVHRADVFRAVEAVAQTGAAVVVMTYYNPVFHYGVSNFARDLSNAGGAGLITPDLIPEEAGEWIEAADELDLEKIFLIAPSSTDERIALTAEATRGFLYAASRMGVTGVQTALGSDARGLVARARAQGARRVAVGIGVSNESQARETAQFADGVIVGSALVKSLLDADGDQTAALRGIANTASSIARGVRSVDAS